MTLDTFGTSTQHSKSEKIWGISLNFLQTKQEGRRCGMNKKKLKKLKFEIVTG